MKWISVKDRLPDNDKLCVIEYTFRGRHWGYQLSRYYIPSNMKTHTWAFEFGNTQPTKVAHWMPLPELPKVKK